MKVSIYTLIIALIILLTGFGGTGFESTNAAAIGNTSTRIGSPLAQAQLIPQGALAGTPDRGRRATFAEETRARGETQKKIPSLCCRLHR